LYTAEGCHLCGQARRTLDAEGVVYRDVDITGIPELEAAYREWLPVVEIDGERAFVYRIPPDALRRKLAAQG
jgi:glutaredoxin